MKPKKQPKKSNNTLFIVLGLLVVSIVLFACTMGNKEQKIIISQEAGLIDVGIVNITNNTQPVIPTNLETTSSSNIVMEKKCTTNNSITNPTLGLVPGSKELTGSNLIFTLKNNGKTDIENIVFEFSDNKGKDATYNKVYKEVERLIEQGEYSNFNLNLDQIGQELGVNIDTFVVYPTLNSKTCENGRIYIIK